VLVEAEFPADIIDVQLNRAVGIVEELLQPVVHNGALYCSLALFFLLIIHFFFFLQDESSDFYKKHQLRELAMLNGTLREESPHMSPSVSPFNSTGMKRAKTGL